MAGKQNPPNDEVDGAPGNLSCVARAVVSNDLRGSYKLITIRIYFVSDRSKQQGVVRRSQDGRIGKGVDALGERGDVGRVNTHLRIETMPAGVKNVAGDDARDLKPAM